MKTDNTGKNIEVYETLFVERLRTLRNEKNISARELSLDLGQNVNYINLIENGKRFPSLQGFFIICDYFKISPSDYFNETIHNLSEKETFLKYFDLLSSDQATHVLQIIQDICSK